MKLLKKSIALILGLTMVYPLVACGGGDNNSSSSDSSSITSDSSVSSDGSDSSDSSDDSSTSSEDPSYTPEIKEQITAQVIQSITQQVSEAKTLSVSAKMTTKGSSKYWTEYQTGSYRQDTYSESVTIEVDAILSKTDSGSYNAKIELSSTMTQTELGATATENQTFSSYIIDGFGYTELEDNIFYKEPLFPDSTIDTLEEISLAVEEVLNTLLEGIELPTIDPNELVSEVTKFASETLSFDANSMSLTYDFAPAVNAVFDYIGNLDPKQTIEQTLNNTLALIDETLTVDAILDQVQNLASLNVQDTLDSLDAWLTEEYQTTLQGVWDSVTDSQDFIDLFIYFATQDGTTSIEANEYLTNVQNFDIATYLSYIEGFENMSIYDVIVSSMYASTEETPTIEDVRSLVDSYLSMKLEDIVPVTYLEQFKGIDVKELSAKAGIGFDSSYTLTEVSSKFVFDASMTYPSEYANKTDSSSQYQSIEATASLSSVAFPIALPDGAIIEEF